MEIQLTAEQQDQLGRLAERTGRTEPDLVLEAVSRYLDHEKAFVEAVDEGLRSLDRGKHLSHVEVGVELGALLRDG